MLKIVFVLSVCAGVTLLLGAINIWAGVLSLPITYGAAKALLAK